MWKFGLFASILLITIYSVYAAPQAPPAEEKYEPVMDIGERNLQAIFNGFLWEKKTLNETRWKKYNTVAGKFEEK